MKHAMKRRLAALLAAAMLFGLLPMSALAAPRNSSRAGGGTIDVTDYGADPTGANESSTAVIKALEAAAELDAATEKTIFFPKGEYHFYADRSQTRKLYVSNTVGTNQSYTNKRLGILLEDMENVTVDGGGSQFIFHGDMTAFATIRSKNIVFENFDMDYASPSVIDVTVESRVEGENAVILYVPACYTYQIDDGNTIQWTVDGSPAHSGAGNMSDMSQEFNMQQGITTRVGGVVFNNVAKLEQVDGDRTHVKVTYNEGASLPNVGSCYELRKTTRTTPGAFLWESENITLRNMNIQYLHGFGIVGQLSKNITIDNVKFQARPGTGRATAGFADFIQMSSVGGKVTITNCDFSNPHDDPINIHGTFLKVIAISDDRRTVTVKYQHSETAGFPQYYKGDTVDFSTLGTMIPVADSARTVESVQNPAADATTDDALRTIVVTLTEPIPDAITADNYVMENVTYTPEVEIKNCRFVETPTRGILVTTRQPVVIENNYFDRMGMAAIFLSCDAQSWWESGRCEDVTIRNNTFIIQPRYRGDAIADAGILVGPTNPSDDADNQIHKHLLIENNTFYMARDVYAVYAKSVKGLTIRNNRFQRYQPNVSMTLSPDSASIPVGGTQSTSLNATGTRYTSKLFYFHACKEVKIDGNIYDDGLNLGAGLASITTAADVAVSNGDAVAVSADKQLPAVGAVSYISSDPAVATVDSAGVITGVSAGRAEIWAYRTAGARTFESDHVAVTVTEAGSSDPVDKIDVTADKDALDVNETANLTAATVPSGASVTWSVKALSEGAAAAIDQSGVLTATAPGVVEVTATAGGTTSSKLVTVNAFHGLNEVWSVTDEVAGNWSLDEANEKVTIKTQSGGDWGNSTGGHNYFLLTAPTGDFEATVKLHNKTCGNSSCWCESGLVLYKDHNNYVSLVRKNNGGTPKLAVNSESGGSPTEGTLLDDTSDDAIYLKLVKSGSSYSGYYSANGTDWSLVRTVDNNISGYKIGFMSVNAGSGHGTVSSTFDSFTLTANGTTTNVPLLGTNAAPTAANAAVTSADGAVRVSYDYADADSDKEEGSAIAWYISDSETGNYTRLEGANTATLSITAATSEKWVKAVVVPRDATGRYGAPVSSAAVRAPRQTVVQTDATLRSLSASGLTLTPAFDPNTTEYAIDLPSSASKVLLAAAATQADVAVAGAGEVAITQNSTTHTVTVTAPGGSTTKTYTLTIRRAKSSEASLSGLTASAGGKSISYAPGTRYYRLVVDKDTSTLNFTAAKADPTAKVAVRFNNQELGEYSALASKALPLTAGLNHLELRVTSEDNASTAIYRVQVTRAASAEAELTSLTVNGKAVDIPAQGADFGVLSTPADGEVTLNAAVSSGATLRISADGKAVENGDEITVTSISRIKLRVVAEDGATETVYTLVLSKPDPANADLYSLELGGMTLSPAFDPAALRYTATFTDSQGTAPLAVRTAQPDASVTCETVSIYTTAEGALARDCHFFRDVTENFVKLTVTSPDGSVTKEYLVNVTYEPVVYLSDLQWESHSSGWSGWPNPGVDIGVENKAMVLRGPNGMETMEKGLGTHASSTTVFDISGRGFTRFVAKVGPNQNSGGSPHISFEVQDGDGIQLWASTGEITHADNYQVIDIDVTGVSKLKLLDKQTTNNSNAHANWGDAKFYGTQIGPAIANTDVPIQHVEFEHTAHTIYANPGDGEHTIKLHPIFKPIGVSQSAHEKVLAWEPSDPSVATVVGGADNNGVVTAVKPGTTTISATAISGATDSCTITVKWKLQGTPSVSGELEFGSELTADVNTFAQDAKQNLEYTWYRGGSAAGTAIGNEKTYTPEEADIGSRLTVKVSGKEGSLYEGETTYTTGVIEKADGPVITGAGASGIHGEKVTTLDENDGKIVGFPQDENTYQWKAVDDPDSDYADVTGAEVTGLVPGDYNVRIKETGTHKAGTPITVTVAGHDVVAHLINIGAMTPANAGTVTRRRGQAEVGEERTLTVRPSEGYQLAENGLSVIGDVSGDEVTPDKGEPVTEGGVTYETYTFIMPDEPVTVTAQFEKKTYTIGHELTHITCDMAEHDHTAVHGEKFSITLTPENGYEMTPTTITVTDGDGRPFTDYTYLAHEDEPAKRVLTFEHGVTRSIKITGTAKLKDYTVVYHITNGLTAPNAPQTVQHGKDLTVTFAAAQGYALPETVTVTVADTELDADEFTYDAGTGALTVPAVTGNVVVAAAGEAQSIGLQSATLVGPARVGRTLTVNTVPVLATVDYQWLLVDEEGVETPIAGATEKTYVIPAEAEGKTIKVTVTATGSYTGALTSAPTATILPQGDPFVFVTSIQLEPETLALAVGRTASVTATVAPEDATSKTLFWSSENEAVATVDQNGVVTAVAEGSTVITASSTDTALSTVTAQCQVTVTKTTTPSRPSSPSSSGTTTRTEVKEDGTKVTTVTKPDGTVTETVTAPDGAKTEKVKAPDEAVTITVTDAEGEELAKVEIPATIPEAEAKFEDLDTVPWAEEAVNNVAALELVKGTGGNKYTPTAPMTRGSLATVLHRLSQGKSDYQNTFKDVAQGKYYTEGVAWAAKANVVKGISEDVFAPDDIITREQLAVMLARYAKLIGMDTKTSTVRLEVFSDGDKTGAWAMDGVAWCVEKGILKGKGGNALDPTAEVSRAEVAVMLDRFIALIK